MNETTLYLSMPPPFDFQAAAYSHGWVLLAPNYWDHEVGMLSRIEQLHDRQVVQVKLNAAGKPDRPRIKIRVRHYDGINKNAKKALKDSVGRMFRQQENFNEFFALCNQEGGRWTQIAGQGWGRLLRSPTIFEDIVKTICTTNIQWAGTKSMVQNLVNTFGEPFPRDPDQRTFPKPAALAAASEAQLTTARLGYRGPYIRELASRVVDGSLDLSGLEDPLLPTEVLQKELLRIKGVGPYAAHTLLMLLGRYEHLAYDTVMRDFLSRKYNLGAKPTLADANRIYGHWGKWKFLAYWFDIWSEG
jgi:3-methyladenine DNA glycosylase/8-oxoguanine DNA glycosylase